MTQKNKTFLISLLMCMVSVLSFAQKKALRSGLKLGSSGKWSDKVSIEQKKTAKHFVYLNNPLN